MKIGAKNEEITNYNRRNAMTPLNWMCGISQSFLLPATTYNYSNWLGIVFFITFLAILIFYAYMYNFFAKNDPNRLQSEEYNLASQNIALTFDKHKGIAGDNSKVYITSASYPQNIEEK